MTDRFACEIDESAGLRELSHQSTIFGEVEQIDPESVLVYCGDKLVRATRVDDRYVCVCGHVVGVAW